MTNYGVYLFDGYKGFYKLSSHKANTVEEVIGTLKKHFKQETELFGLHCTNGRKYQIKVGRKVVAEFELHYDSKNGYNF